MTTAALYQPLVQADQLPFRYESLESEARRELGGPQRIHSAGGDGRQGRPELAALEFAEQQEASLNREIEALYQRVDPEQTLRQITGLGPVLAATVEAFSNPIRFSSVRKYAAKQSTERIDHLPHDARQLGDHLCPRCLQQRSPDLAGLDRHRWDEFWTFVKDRRRQRSAAEAQKKAA